jgi:hypothetical protein
LAPDAMMSSDASTLVSKISMQQDSRHCQGRQSSCALTVMIKHLRKHLLHLATGCRPKVSSLAMHPQNLHSSAIVFIDGFAQSRVALLPHFVHHHVCEIGLSSPESQASSEGNLFFSNSFAICRHCGCTVDESRTRQVTWGMG